MTIRGLFLINRINRRWR